MLGVKVTVCYNGGVFGLTKPKLPITQEQRKWVDDSFVSLASFLGVQRLLQATVVSPTAEHFPDVFDGSEAALQRMFCRIATQMQGNPADVDVTLFASGHDLTRSLVPFYEGVHSAPGGLYHHDPNVRPHISINEIQLKDPMSLVAVLAHELGHIILLRPGLVDRTDSDMEPLNDLLTIFLGFGIFTANSAFRFEQHSDHRSEGWSNRRLGYLSEEQLGYALARFAFERHEGKPPWISLLAINVATYLKRSPLGWKPIMSLVSSLDLEACCRLGSLSQILSNCVALNALSTRIRSRLAGNGLASARVFWVDNRVPSYYITLAY